MLPYSEWSQPVAPQFVLELEHDGGRCADGDTASQDRYPRRRPEPLQHGGHQAPRQQAFGGAGNQQPRVGAQPRQGQPVAKLEQRQGQRHVDQHPGLRDHVVVDDAAAEHAGEQSDHRVADDTGTAEPAAADLSGQARANQRETYPEQSARHQRQRGEKLAQSVHARHGNGRIRRKM
jgi:hypothetical protein